MLVQPAFSVYSEFAELMSGGFVSGVSINTVLSGQCSVNLDKWLSCDPGGLARMINFRHVTDTTYSGPDH